tara:strand:+ start:28 stop:702 length:675 start_codon:yes stop_codon:yes gene_type:complete
MQLRLNNKILFYIFLIIFLSTLNNKFFSEIRLKTVDKITIKGLEGKEKRNLMNELELLDLKNILFLNKFEIIKKLEANELIENYTIFKKYPSTLEIRINKTKFLANVFKDGKSFVLGSNGKLIQTFDKNNNLPNIFGYYNKESFFNLIKYLKKSNFEFFEIKNLYFFKSGRWDIETHDNMIIKLPKKNLVASLNLAFDLINYKKSKNIKILDLRQEQQVIINEK